jgi:hypothetical protein
MEKKRVASERTVAATPRCFMAFYFLPISASRNL